MIVRGHGNEHAEAYARRYDRLLYGHFPLKISFENSNFGKKNFESQQIFSLALSDFQFDETFNDTEILTIL